MKHITFYWLIIVALQHIGCDSINKDVDCRLKIDNDKNDIVALYDSLYKLENDFSVREEEVLYYAEENIYRAGGVNARYVLCHDRESDLLFVCCLFSRDGSQGLVIVTHSLDENGILLGPEICHQITTKTLKNGDVEITASTDNFTKHIQKVISQLNRSQPHGDGNTIKITLRNKANKQDALVNGREASIYAHRMQDIEAEYMKLFGQSNQPRSQKYTDVSDFEMKIYVALHNMGMMYVGKQLKFVTLPEWIAYELNQTIE